MTTLRWVLHLLTWGSLIDTVASVALSPLLGATLALLALASGGTAIVLVAAGGLRTGIS